MYKGGSSNYAFNNCATECYTYVRKVHYHDGSLLHGYHISLVSNYHKVII